MSEHYEQLYQGILDSLYKSDFVKAEFYITEILKSYPNDSEANHLSGLVKNAQGKLDEAINFIKRAISLNPSSAVYYTNLGEVYNRKGFKDEAIKALEQSIALNPDFGGARYNLANILKSLGRTNEAIKYYQDAIELDPNNHQAFYNLGNTLYDIGNIESAIICYKNACVINPDFEDSLFNLANSLFQIKKIDECLIYVKDLLRVNPRSKVALKLCAVAYEEIGKSEESLKYYLSSFELDSDNMGLKLHLETLIPWINLSLYEIEEYRKKLEHTYNVFINEKIKINVEQLSENPHPPSVLIYQGKNNKEIKELYSKIINNSFNITNLSFSTDKKIKLGFVVTKTNEGIFTKFTKGLINNLSNTDFELVIFADLIEAEKKILPNLTNKEVKFVDMPKKNQDIIDTIRNYNCDIIYHWEVGTDMTNYFLPYFKLAPIQFTSLGWPETTGIKEINYFISSELLEIESAQQEHYTEKLVKLKNLPFYIEKANIPTLKDKSYFGFSNNFNYYVCIQNLRKFHINFEKVVADILRKDPKGILVLVDDKYENVTSMVRNRIKTLHPDIYSRVKFLNKLQYDDYLSLINCADVLLDTFYFGGANTTYEAMQLGVPVVTLPWDLQRGRFTYAAYKKMEIYDCIAKDEEEYKDIAIKIGNSREIRAYISQKIKSRSDILFNDISVVQELSNLFKSWVSK
jgi:protein O-GlcNAc transferase